MIPMPLDSTLISVSPDVMGGTPVFAGTRVPIETLFDYLKAGESVDDFFRGVSYSDQGAGRWAPGRSGQTVD